MLSSIQKQYHLVNTLKYWNLQSGTILNLMKTDLLFSLTRNIMITVRLIMK
nr:MAG TPA: hypothetical protein [Caudoviricetes sp.]